MPTLLAVAPAVHETAECTNLAAETRYKLRKIVGVQPDVGIKLHDYCRRVGLQLGQARLDADLPRFICRSPGKAARVESLYYEAVVILHNPSCKIARAVVASIIHDDPEIWGQMLL
jgi:hypothetical protein